MNSFKRIVAVILLVAIVVPGAAGAEGLMGNVKVDAGESKDEPVIQPQSAQMEVQPPTWIQGKVFTNDDMYMYSFFRIIPFKKEWKWAIPQRTTTLGLRPSVVRHWKGYKPDGKCPVTVMPMGKGKFKFQHARADGPHGYMERVGLTADGFPRYRFWFDDDPDASKSEDK